MVALSEKIHRPTRLLGKRPNPIEDEARQALEASQWFRGRAKLIRIDERDGRLVLQGKLPSFYLKQMLQTLLKQVNGVKQIDNQVDVDWPAANE